MKTSTFLPGQTVGRFLLSSIALILTLGLGNAWASGTSLSGEAADFAPAVAQAITPGPVPDDLIIEHNDLKWVWASPCLYEPCSSPDPANQEGWRYATDDELAARPACSDFLRPDGTLRCASEFFDPNHTHCDYLDCEDLGAVASSPDQACFEGAPEPRCESWYVMDIFEFEKQLTSGEDFDGDGFIDLVVPVKPGSAYTYDYTIVYRNPLGPPALVADTLPAEWIAKLVEGMPVDVDECGESDTADGNHGTVDIYKNGKPGKKCQSATEIEWIPTASEDATLTKGPDFGPWWLPLSNDGGTYVYSNSFVALDDGKPIQLGMWLQEEVAPAPTVRFEIWGDTGGAGPDPFSVLATTGSFLPGADASLNFYSAPVLPGAATLAAGATYWFAATVVGEPVTTGYYRVGGHTQNSVYPDDGTFWYSNDPAGITFDGQDLTPEMAFEVMTSGTPTLNVESMTRPSPGKGHKSRVFAPTSCGPLYLNEGAYAFELDPATGEPLPQPPFAATNQLCLAVVRDVNGDGFIDTGGGGDEDGDGLSDLDEACLLGTDPCVFNTCVGLSDICIDGDGIATPGRGLPAAGEVWAGQPLTGWPTGRYIEGLDWFDNDGTCTWTFGDDLHLEDPAGSCASGIRDGIHDVGADCDVLDLDGSFFPGQQVDVDLETGTTFTGCPGPDPLLMFYDSNGNGYYDNGEDIVLDANANGVFD